MLPAPILEALGPRAADAPYVPLRSGIGTPVGESHLVVLDGALRVFARGSLLDPLVELAGVERAHIELSALRAELVLDCPKERGVISLGFGETELVEELLGGLQPSKIEAAPEVAALEVGAPADGLLAAELLGTLELTQRRFLGVLAARERDLQAAARSKPAGGRASDQRPHKKGAAKQGRPPRKGAEPVRKRPETVYEPIPEVTRDAPEVPGARSATAAWIVLLALIVIGIGSAVRRLLLSP